MTRFFTTKTRRHKEFLDGITGLQDKIFYHGVHEEHEVFSAKSAQKKMPLENKFSRHFFFASRRKKKCGYPFGLAEKRGNAGKFIAGKRVDKNGA